MTCMDPTHLPVFLASDIEGSQVWEVEFLATWCL